MKKVIYITVNFFTFLVFAQSQKKNTMLESIKLTDKEIEVVLKEVKNTDSLYDPALNLVWATQSVHYHSDFKEATKVHSVMQSLKYAEALCDSGKPEKQERGFNVLRAVIALQDQDLASETCGIWPYTFEEPFAARKSPVDRNWADFPAVSIVSIINNHKNILPDDLESKMQKALLYASQAIRKRDVRPDYTNISLMGLYVCYMTADMYNDADLMLYARKRLKGFYDCTVLNKGFLEYNSPTYLKLALDETLRLKDRVINKEDYSMLDYIYHTGWSTVAHHYHKPSAQWSGPLGRCYGVLLGASTYNWLYVSSNGIINPDTGIEFPKDSNPRLKHKIPADLLSYFTDPKFPRIQIDTLIRANQKIELNPLVSYQESDRGVWIKTKEVIGKTYHTKDFVLSSINRSSLWNQRRPLLAYWGSPQKPVSMQIRFLHDKYDYAAANIFCAQDSINVLGAINFTTNGGDKHVTIDVIKNATIKATDLRLRFEFGGDINSINFDSTAIRKNIISGKSGNVNFRVNIPYLKFGNYKTHCSIGGDNKNKWIDYVIYSGVTKEFNFKEINEAVIGFLLTMKTGQIASDTFVEVDKSQDKLILEYKKLKVNAVTRPYSERATLLLK